MDSVFIYWDTWNFFIGPQWSAKEREGTPGARYLVQINYEAVLRLAHAGRDVRHAVAVGSLPPDLHHIWDSLEKGGVEAVDMFELRDQEMPQHLLQLRMLEDALDHSDDPGIAVLLIGDGLGYLKGGSFHRTLERMHRRGWRIEILSWMDSDNQDMRRWAEENGVFVALDDFYEAITFREPSRPGHDYAPARDSAPLDLSWRETA